MAASKHIGLRVESFRFAYSSGERLSCSEKRENSSDLTLLALLGFGVFDSGKTSAGSPRTTPAFLLGNRPTACPHLPNALLHLCDGNVKQERPKK